MGETSMKMSQKLPKCQQADENCSAIFIIYQENSSQIILRYHHALTRIAKIKMIHSNMPAKKWNH